MRFVVSLLALGVILRHTAHNFLPPILSVKAWFYVNGALWETTLCLLIFCYLWLLERNRWVRLGMVACAIGVLESLQMSVCMLAAKTTIGVKGNLCDHVTGLPVGASMMALYIIFICWVGIRK